MGDEATELYRQHTEGHSKFVYFLLGVSASAIAFAIHETRGERLTALHAPIGVAVLLFAASFAAGLSGLGARQKVMMANAEILKLQRGVKVPPPALSVADCIDAMRHALEDEAVRGSRRWRWQQWCLFAGALAYIVGHVLMMAEVAK